MIKVGFIDYFLDEWHANNYPSMFQEASNPSPEVVIHRIANTRQWVLQDLRCHSRELVTNYSVLDSAGFARRILTLSILSCHSFGRCPLFL